MWKWYDAEITAIEEQSPSTRLFKLKVKGDEAVVFKAGQFVTMDLPISDKRLKRWRSYSIANAPKEGFYTEGGGQAPIFDELEFSIVKSEKSTGGSAFLFEQATVGTPIRFKGPDGSFTLRTNLVEKDVVFICTGTGVAPFRSMLWDIYNRQLAHRQIHLIFGARYERDILFREEFAFLEKNLPHFRFDVALSREENWQGKKGYVHQVYTEGYAQKRSDVDFYICGWSKMIDETVAKLMVELGYDRSQIHYELYG
jgi:CDP-4-dehydro-6-deoxyglucose reductase